MIRPLRDLVLIERDAPEDSIGSLYIPEAHRDWRSTNAVAIAVGPKTNTVKVGDRLLVALYGGNEIRDEGILRALIPETEILGVYARV